MLDEFPHHFQSEDSISWRQVYIDRLSCIALVDLHLCKMCVKCFKSGYVDNEMLADLVAFGERMNFGFVFLLNELHHGLLSRKEQ